MNVTTLVSRMRSEILDDELIPYLWSNTNLINYLNDTIDEIAEEHLIIVDQSTDSVVEVDLMSNQTLHSISDSILHIRFGRLESTGYGVIRTTEDWLNANISDWRTTTGSAPTYFAPSATQGYLSIYPQIYDATSKVMDTLLLTVNRMPLTPFTIADIAAATDITDIKSMHHSKLLNGMAKRAFLKPDSETYDKGKAEYHRGLFEVDKKKIKRDIILFNKPDKTRTIRSGTGIYY